MNLEANEALVRMQLWYTSAPDFHTKYILCTTVSSHTLLDISLFHLPENFYLKFTKLVPLQMLCGTFQAGKGI